MKPKCERCGSCCLQIERLGKISEEDIRRWVNEVRVDILQYCQGWAYINGHEMIQSNEAGLISYLNESPNWEMWYDPKSGNEIHLCPFLRKKCRKNEFECMIDDTKPEMCRDYICDPRSMTQIIKKSFEKNLKEYRKKRKKYRSFIRTSPFIGNPSK